MLCHAVTLNFYSTLGVMHLNSVWAQSNNLRSSYWQFSTFSLWNFTGWGSSTEQFSGLHGANFTKLGEDIAWSWLHRSLFLLHFQTCARSLYQLLKLYQWPNLWNTFDGHPLHGWWARCIDNRKFMVKLKALTYHVAWPNKSGGKLPLPSTRPTAMVTFLVAVPN